MSCVPRTEPLAAPLAARLQRYLVTDARVADVDDLLARSEAALRGGITVVQLRARGWDDRRLWQAASGLRRISERYGALLIINDRVDVATASDADGVHLGVGDLPVAVARRLLPPGALLGFSPETEADRLEAEAAGIDYLGVGPVYGTQTKDDAGAAIGLHGLQRVVAATALPVVGIGGIAIDTAAAVVATGAVGVAVVGAVFLAADPELAARDLRTALGA